MALLVMVPSFFTGGIIGADPRTGDFKRDGEPFRSWILGGFFSVLKFLIMIELYVGAVAIIDGIWSYAPDRTLGGRFPALRFPVAIGRYVEAVAIAYGIWSYVLGKVPAPPDEPTPGSPAVACATNWSAQLSLVYICFSFVRNCSGRNRSHLLLMCCCQHLANGYQMLLLDLP